MLYFNGVNMSEFPSNIDELINCLENSSIFKFQIKVVPNSKLNSIEFFDNFIKIKIKEKPIDGKANKAIIEYLSDTLNIAKSKISILSGQNNSIKMIQIKK